MFFIIGGVIATSYLFTKYRSKIMYELLKLYSNLGLDDYLCGETEIKNDIEKILNFWKITKKQLFSKTKEIWSKSFRPINTNKDLVGSGFDTSN